ncbi:MAG: hypothetical protein QOH59_2047, partial [Gemmatimonadales bacterium]|nr:hypothetical protein [Gemmatimonadales bacterium]
MSRTSGVVGLVLVFGVLWLPDTAHSQVLRPSRLELRQAKAIPAPQGVIASATGSGVEVSWQPVAEAARYLVLRGAGGSATGSQIAELSGGERSYLDRGFGEPAAYQVIAMAADGRTSASAWAQYTPPAAMVKAVPTATRTVIVKSPTMLGRAPNQTLGMGPPRIETVGKNVHNGMFIYNGDTVQVTGSGFTGLSGVYLAGGYCNSYGCQINPNAGAPKPVTPIQVSASSFSFVPQVNAPYTNQLYTHFLIVTKGSEADTSDTKLEIGAARPVKKIISVKQVVVRSGLRIDVTGVGLDQVDGAYFGTGTPGSQSNPLYSIANRSSTGVQIVTTAS